MKCKNPAGKMAQQVTVLAANCGGLSVIPRPKGMQGDC